MAVVVARILGLKTGQQYDLAMEQIDTAGKLYLGMWWDLIGLLSSGQLAGLFDNADNSLNRYLAVRLLTLKADVLEAMGSSEEALAVCNKALVLAETGDRPVMVPEGEPDFQELLISLKEKWNRLNNNPV